MPTFFLKFLSALGAPVNVGTNDPLPVIMVAGSSPTSVTLAEGTKNVAAINVPERITAVSTLVDRIDIKAKSTNTGSVRIGFQAADGTQVWELVPGEWKSINAPSGKKLDISSIYFDVDVAAEGIVYETFA